MAAKPGEVGRAWGRGRQKIVIDGVETYSEGIWLSNVLLSFVRAHDNGGGNFSIREIRGLPCSSGSGSRTRGRKMLGKFQELSSVGAVMRATAGRSLAGPHEDYLLGEGVPSKSKL